MDPLLSEGHSPFEDMSPSQWGSLIGWISIGCWIVVYTPQIWTCYVLKSGEGLSVAFLIIWLTGDLAAWLGAAIQKLLPTVQYLAAYYTACDIILLFQVFYYRRRSRTLTFIHAPLTSTDPESNVDESTPLFNAHKVQTFRFSPLQRTLLGYGFGILFVLIVGLVGYVVSDRKSWHHGGGGRIGLPEEIWNDRAQIIGWISALLYLGSRIPQIAKNSETKGLALGFFCFSLVGNLTYSASIMIPSLDVKHIMVNLPWLVGSLGTIALDLMVLFQFWIYRHARNALEKGLIENTQRDEEIAPGPQAGSSNSP